jgi:enoyl-CoA hydratase
VSRCGERAGRAGFDPIWVGMVRPGNGLAVRPPLSVAMTKLTVNRLANALDDLASRMDVDQFALASMIEDHKQGVDAFLTRRKPKFRGR